MLAPSYFYKPRGVALHYIFDTSLSMLRPSHLIPSSVLSSATRTACDLVALRILHWVGVFWEIEERLLSNLPSKLFLHK